MLTIAIRICVINGRRQYFCNWIDWPHIPKKGELVNYFPGLELRAGKVITQGRFGRFAGNLLSMSIVSVPKNIEQVLENNRFIRVDFPSKEELRSYEVRYNGKFS